VKITKFEHSCVELGQDGSNLVIDPGSFLAAREFDDVVAVVITHEHPDHWTPGNVRAILDRNPGARVVGPQGVATAVGDALPVEIVAPGDSVEIGPFRLRFFGGKHIVIHESIPIIDNVGVLVNDAFYYGGDSYDGPDVPVEVLAAPIGAPWLKISEAMDYVLAVKPKRAFYIHDGPLSPAGITLASPRLKWATEQGGGLYLELAPGESVEV
jgi:L-ascorbate metabolism protein UlaG (beta-lactamase superfamily)